jgi:hypothetical protein
LNAKTKTVDPLAFAEQVETICTLYAYAPLLHALGGHIVSCDEMTGIQALERIAPTQPMRKGRVERREFEYKRHGTLSLIANFDVVTGQIVQPSIGPRRTEADFVRHIAQTIATDPDAVWVFLSDQLNTHQSESLVRLVAQRCLIADELGVKGETGVLQSLATRAAFLSDPAHRIQFVYVPKHTSWLNQVEERPTDYTWRPRQPQQHPNLPSVPSFGGSDRRSGSALSTKGRSNLLGHLPA